MEESFDFQIDFDNLSNAPELFRNLRSPESPEETPFEEIIQGAKKTYRCLNPDCGKIFKFKSDITRHVIIHQKDRPYSCTYPECKKSFKRSDALKDHMRIHTGVHPFECDIPGCDKKFVTKAALKYHQTRHNNNREFRCDFPNCNKSFLTASQLKQHQKAFNLHMECAASKAIEEPILVVKSYEKNQDLCQDDFQEDEELTPKSSDLNTQWEIGSQSNGDEDLNSNTPANFETMFKHILKQNQILKEKLTQCRKTNSALQKGEHCYPQC